MTEKQRHGRSRGIVRTAEEARYRERLSVWAGLNEAARIAWARAEAAQKRADDEYLSVTKAREEYEVALEAAGDVGEVKS